jgi:NADPH:quinone reductase-like Zn-dependent oxidoreductase
MLMRKPDNMSWETAAGVSETYSTAVQALHLVAGITPGQTVLVHAGASGVGQALIQVARISGAGTIFATAGSDAKCALCKELGADVAIDYRTPAFDEVVKRETAGRGVDLIVDLVGRDYWARNVASAAMDGKIVLVALMSGGLVEQVSLRELMNKRLSILPTTLRTRSAGYRQELRDKVMELVVPELESGEIGLVVDRVYPWTAIADAHKRLESGEGAGKVICRIT